MRLKVLYGSTVDFTEVVLCVLPCTFYGIGVNLYNFFRFNILVMLNKTFFVYYCVMFESQIVQTCIARPTIGVYCGARQHMSLYDFG